ncbi:phage regulatory CII family protein [Chromobacterium piscinae]|uniref:phage regulatory CII family protein n=1 Tax=Chromobacterium piscinae TaxID=686831 RepID=UPI00320ADFFA
MNTSMAASLPSAPADVFGALHLSAKAFGITKLAGVMRVSAGVLTNKLAPVTHHHKATLDDFIQVLRITQDLSPLDALCRLFDSARYQLPRLDNVSDSALLDLVNKVHAEGGDVHRCMNEALADGIVTQDEFNEVDCELMEWIAAIVELRNRFGSLVVKPSETPTYPLN